ncbi:hypothetical protein CORC01_09420 [Colletotrichum orchidophilum]|uniref:DUF1996 domain-containing protein n=1 Tax=Colletotrichum orchidophilum TaxID=1209926 RepID=A0A1G4B1S8_9PEZI|nr:uncharacterized protein CORC01_09420 [Colletotrichum orchidophilum]OHE95275.1 hypothetical protein CORC01_09420 [Colletotrichum orchidophilum]
MRKNIDPLVLSGQYKSHMHSSSGSDAVKVNMSPTAELQKGCSPTQNPNNFSVYYSFEKDLVTGSEVTWLCQNQAFDPGGKAYSQFQQETCSTSLQAVLWFPNCVDEKKLKSTYSDEKRGVCAQGMKRVPQPRTSIRYDAKKAVPEPRRAGKGETRRSSWNVAGVTVSMGNS